MYRLTPTGQNEFNLALGPIRNDIIKQGEIVRKLKEENALKTSIEPEVAKLKKLRRELSKVENDLMPNDSAFNGEKFNALLKNRFFHTQSAELYGGSAGFVDFGPGLIIFQLVENFQFCDKFYSIDSFDKLRFASYFLRYFRY